MFIGLLFLTLLHAQDNGAYLSRVAGCITCHTSSTDQILAGGVLLKSPFGTFVTPNITSDYKTGIGSWTEKQFFKAMRHGVSPNGSLYYPSFPYRAFTKLRDKDIRDIFYYLKNSLPISKQNKKHDIDFPFDQRWLLVFWQNLFFKKYKDDRLIQIRIGVGQFKKLTSESELWNRGAYLVEGAIHCTECHTPRGKLGELIVEKWMTGSEISFRGKVPPDISSLNWSKEDWERFLSSGFTPQLTNPGVEMAEVIQQTSVLTKQDRKAVIEYLMNLDAK